MDRLIIALVLALAVLPAVTTGDAGIMASAPTSHNSIDIDYMPASLFDNYGAVTAIPLEELVAGPVKPFRQCADCKCCDPNDRSKCKVMKCCFGIVCNIPGRPNGQCSLMPKTCNCNNCQW